MGKILNIIIGLIAVIAMHACNTSGCTENQNALPLAGLYSSSTGAAISVDSLAIGGVGAPNDSLLYDGSSAASVVYLPLRSTTQSTSFYFKYRIAALNNPALNDTITFAYSSTPTFVSEQCGAMYFYRINRVAYTRHLIDSVAVTDSLITNTDLERIKIYFRTQSPTDPNVAF